MNATPALQVQVSAKADGCWPDKIAEFGGNLFHAPQWADTRRSANNRPLYFELRDSQRKCHGIALAIEMWSPAPLIGKLSKQLLFETYPVVRDDRNDLVQTMVQHILAHARKHGCRAVTFNSYMSRTLLSQPDDLGVTIDSRIEFIIDLTKSDNELYAGFNSHHKRKIKKARKHDLVFYESQDLEAMRQFRQLQKRSRDRRLERGESMAVMEDTYYEELGKRYFAADLGTVFMLLYDGSPVSAAFVAHFADQAIYMYGGSNNLGFKMDAPPLLFSRIFSRYREQGCRIFNLGGAPAQAEQPNEPSHGLFRFKAGFGGEQRLCQNAVAENLNPGRDKMFNMVKRLLMRD